jgi:glycosyltransferase involved in cell wall biosynthesis
MKAHFAGTPTTFLGELRGRELAVAYASADMFVMPSETETLGNVVGEVKGPGMGLPLQPRAQLVYRILVAEGVCQQVVASLAYINSVKSESAFLEKGRAWL